MAFRNRLRCFICDDQFPPQNMARIDGDENAQKREIAINRREGFNRPGMDITPLTRICFVCNRGVMREITIVRQNPMCLRLNVLARTRTSSCFICNAQDDIHRLPIECKASVFLQCNIYIPENVRSCRGHLDRDGFILRPLLDGLNSINQPCIIVGPYLADFLEGVRNVARRRERFDDPNNLTDDEFLCLTSLTKEQFEDFYSFCDPVPCQGGHRYVRRVDLLAFSAKMHQGLSDEFLKVLFRYSSRQATSLAMATVRSSLMQNFVPNNIGFGSITRDEFIRRHVTDFANHLYNPEPQRRRAILFIDATYSFIFKSMNFRVLRQTFSRHKGRHLAKPGLIVGPDGHIVEIQEPHFADHHNNDAAILRDDLEDENGPMRQWLQEGDIVIVDRGYRDIIPYLEELGLTCYMPPFLEAGERQLSTADANQSRIVTKMRWVVEARNGHVKSICKFLSQTMQIQHLPHLGDFFRIAGAIINRYHPPITMEGADVELARRMLDRATQENVLQLRVVEERLAARDARRWIRLDAGRLADFPVLTVDYLKDLTCGVYQVGLAPSYVRDKLQREEEEEMQVEVHENRDVVPEEGLLRVRLHSRFRNASRYQLWVTYTPQNDCNDQRMDVDAPPIQNYYCTCMSGARTLGCCAHVASVLWYLGYARHAPNVAYPSQILLETIADAAHRPQQINPQ